MARRAMTMTSTILLCMRPSSEYLRSVISAAEKHGVLAHGWKQALADAARRWCPAADGGHDRKGGYGTQHAE